MASAPFAMLMMTRYLFFRFYVLSTVVNRDETNHAANAVIMLSFVLLLNVFAVDALIFVSTGHRFLGWVGTGPIYGIVTGALVMLCVFVWSRIAIDVDGLARQGKRETIEQTKRGNAIAVAYAVGSLLLVIGLQFLGAALQ